MAGLPTGTDTPSVVNVEEHQVIIHARAQTWITQKPIYTND